MMYITELRDKIGLEVILIVLFLINFDLTNSFNGLFNEFFIHFIP